MPDFTSSPYSGSIKKSIYHIECMTVSYHCLAQENITLKTPKLNPA